MKKVSSLLFVSILLSLTFQSCAAVETIFKAGMWWAFILMALVIGLVFWLLRGRKS